MTVDRAARPEEGPSGTDFEVTPAMIEAGALAFVDCDPDFERPEDAAIAIFRAMIEAMTAHPSPASH